MKNASSSWRVAVNPAICDYDTEEVIFLPTDHYDFVGYNVKGKTKQQILEEVMLMKHEEANRLVDSCM